MVGDEMPQRYFLNPSGSLSEQDQHHIKHVMRMKTGDQVIICDHQVCHLAILNVNQNITYDFKEVLPFEKQTNISILQGLPKGQKSESIIKTASYFGADQLIFTPFERSIAKLENISHKSNRYQLIAKEASELSHRHSILSIHFEAKTELIDYQIFDLILLADENEKDISIKDVLKKYRHDQKTLLIIGPEGGISTKEREMFKKQGAISVHLGKNILPTEYAHIYMLCALSLENHSINF
jgi:16S rRNA (uracil1498-N3)-methyltransferase